MTSRRGCFFLVSGLFAVLVLGGGVFFILNNAAQNRLERLQALNAPPDVYVTAPETGTVVSPGSFELVQVVAAGPNPIQRIEVWWDGVKLDESINDNEIADGFTASFSVQVAVGSHMLVARVVDAKGIIGQSLPLGIYGDPELATTASEAFVFSEEGQTAEDLAAAFSVPITDIQAANPGLPAGSLPAGQQVILPPSSGNVVAPPLSPSQSNGNVAILLPDSPMLQVNPKDLTPNNLVLFSGGTDQDKPVKAPTGLQLELADCKVFLRWDDNANNELGYSVWMSDFIRPGRVVANLRPSPTTGPAWFQFDAPPPGNYGIWVVAANWLGAQQSEIVWFRVPNQNCPSQTARDLEFEVVLLDIFGSWDRAYCYVSAEGFPEQRIPPRKDSFYYALAANQPSTPKKNLFSIPPDRVLNLQGECWKWSGSNLTKIGDVNEAIPEALWDGQMHGMAVGSSSIFYRINPLGDLKAIGQYAYTDTSITPPHSLRQEPAVQSVPAQTSVYDPQRVLFWEWNGKEAINGFTIYVSGVAVKHVGPSERKIPITLTARCGEKGDLNEVEVAATLGKAESRRAVLGILLEPCPIMATVEFVQLQLNGADDGLDIPRHDLGQTACDSYLNAYFTLSASFGSQIEKREYFDEDDNLKPALVCGTYNFPILVVGSPLHRNPPPPNKVIFTGLLDGGTTNTANVGVGISMYDEDDFGDDKIVSFFTFFVDSLENWKTYDKTEIISFHNFPHATGNVTIRVTGQQMQP